MSIVIAIVAGALIAAVFMAFPILDLLDKNKILRTTLHHTNTMLEDTRKVARDVSDSKYSLVVDIDGARKIALANGFTDFQSDKLQMSALVRQLVTVITTKSLEAAEQVQTINRLQGTVAERSRELVKAGERYSEDTGIIRELNVALADTRAKLNDVQNSYHAAVVELNDLAEKSQKPAKKKKAKK